jgi:hypothetical protein
LALVILGMAVATAAHAVTWSAVVGCAFGGQGTDPVSHGFYVTSYGGNNLGQVELAFTTSVNGGALWRIPLTAHRGAFDGPVLGTQTATITVPSSGEAHVLFDFGGVPVTAGDIVAFTITAQQLSGVAGALSFDPGTGSCPNVTRTTDTSPPLSTPDGSSMGIAITAQTVTTTCVPSDTLLCLDNVPGDNRFAVNITFNTTQAGGHYGNGQALSMDDRGVSHGGLFWFFSQDNPEVLVKVLNGCTLNNKFWVYFAADTNVGFSLTVHDLQTNQLFTYTNPDRTEPPNLQSVNALPCS